MVTLQLINSFLKDPMTDKLFHKYVTDPKARRVFETTVRLAELAVIAAPLVVTAVRGIRDVATQSRSRRRSGVRRLMPA